MLLVGKLYMDDLNGQTQLLGVLCLKRRTPLIPFVLMIH